MPHAASIASAGAAARQGGAAWLGDALQRSRADTLALFERYRAALGPGLAVPQAPEFNPPLWELGHIGWFQDFWLARNPQRGRGCDADPDAPRLARGRANADALYDSSRVPHASRWHLPLPDAAQTCAELAEQLARTLTLLADADPSDAGLYFFRLALLHEDMHQEAGLYMAQGLGLDLGDLPGAQAPRLPAPPAPLQLPAGRWQLGRSGQAGEGFAFDNELGVHALALDACEIDAQVLRWAEFLPFVEAGAYRDPRLWSAAGWAALAGRRQPRWLRRAAGGWQQWRHGHWQDLALDEAACWLSAHEAQAWCRWAGRRLPSEAEWERAALATAPGAFRWGEVWEWTASPFAPYPGFRPHPYRDYSAPWFDGRPVLRGASFLSSPRLRDARYRNYFPAGRCDVPAGLRSCAAAQPWR